MARVSLSDQREYMITNLWVAFLYSIGFSLLYVKEKLSFFSAEALFWTLLMHVYLCIVANAVVVFPDISWIRWSRRMSGGRQAGKSLIGYSMTTICVFFISFVGWFYTTSPYLLLRIFFINCAAVMLLRVVGYYLPMNSRLLHNIVVPTIFALGMVMVFRSVFPDKENNLLLVIGYLSTLMMYIAWVSHVFMEQRDSMPVLALHVVSMFFLATMYFQFYAGMTNFFIEAREREYFFVPERSPAYTEPTQQIVDEGLF